MMNPGQGRLAAAAMTGISEVSAFLAAFAQVLGI